MPSFPPLPKPSPFAPFLPVPFLCGAEFPSLFSPFLDAPDFPSTPFLSLGEADGPFSLFWRLFSSAEIASWSSLMSSVFFFTFFESASKSLPSFSLPLSALLLPFSSFSFDSLDSFSFLEAFSSPFLSSSPFSSSFLSLSSWSSTVSPIFSHFLAISLS